MEEVTSSSLQASRHLPSFQIRLDFSKRLDRQTLDTSGGNRGPPGGGGLTGLGGMFKKTGEVLTKGGER